MVKAAFRHHRLSGAMDIFPSGDYHKDLYSNKFLLLEKSIITIHRMANSALGKCVYRTLFETAAKFFLLRTITEQTKNPLIHKTIVA